MRNIQDETNLNQKKVLLRLDLNVPLENGKITDTTRIDKILHTINFLLKSGANQSIFVQGKIWREKTNIRLQNHELAIQNLRPIAKSLKPRNKFYPLANATVANAFINLKEIDSAAYYIKRAALAAPKRKSKARYLFITGQVFELLGKKDSAQWAYKGITNLKRKASRKFYINANVKQMLLDNSTEFEDRIEHVERVK